MWDENKERVVIPGEQSVAGVFSLRPATTYNLRIMAENEVGISDPSDVVTIITAEEGMVFLLLFSYMSCVS